MAVLKPTGIVGRVETLLIAASNESGIEKGRVDDVVASYAGFDGDSHAGLTRPACVRVKAQYEPGTQIRNTRQVSALSVEELAQVAAAMQIDEIRPEWVGANLVVSGIPDFTLVPPSSRLIFASGAALVVDMENAPCRFPAEIIEGHFPGKGLAFANKARGKRGVTCWVEREGPIRTGDAVTLHIPPQRIYAHA